QRADRSGAHANARSVRAIPVLPLRRAGRIECLGPRDAHFARVGAGWPERAGAAYQRRRVAERVEIAMIPGKRYTPELLLQLARRHKWRILVPAVLIAGAGSAITHYLPNRYRSDTLILVVPQRVPESYVRSTVTTRIEDRLQSISQQIMSRTRLERVIQDFNLYAEARKTAIMEDVVDRMRGNISVQVVKGDAFRVSFTSDEA